MLTDSPAIKKSGQKTIYVRQKGVVMLISDGKTPLGKWHIIDICFGNTKEAIDDLRCQGYKIEKF